MAQVGKESACNAGDPGLIPGSGRSPGEGNGKLQSPSAVILELRKIKSDTVSTVSPSICHECMACFVIFAILQAKERAFLSPLLPAVS